MRLRPLLALGSLTALALVGCSSGTDAEPDTSRTTSAAAASQTPAPPEQGTDEESDPASDAAPGEMTASEATVGGEHTFASGWRVQVAEPEPVESDARPGEAPAFVVEVSVTNGTGTDHDLSRDYIEVRAGGEPAIWFSDDAAGITRMPQEILPAGESISFRLGFETEAVETVAVFVSSTVGGAIEETTFRTG